MPEANFADKTIWTGDNLGRKWVGIDISPKSIELVNMRLQQAKGSLFHHGYVAARTGIPRHRHRGTHSLPPEQARSVGSAGGAVQRLQGRLPVQAV